MKKIIKTIRTCMLLPFVIPHLIAFFVSSKQKIIIEDITINAIHYKYSGSTIVKLIHLVQDNTYFRTLFYFRIGRIAKLFSWFLRGDNSFIICAKIEGGVYVAHPFSTIIYANTIGKHFVCHQNTTIGNKNDTEELSCPTIGDNVTVGANSCIIGNIRLGNNVVVGAGSVVVKDVPDNAVVAGNPAKIIKFL